METVQRVMSSEMWRRQRRGPSAQLSLSSSTALGVITEIQGYWGLGVLGVLGVLGGTGGTEHTTVGGFGPSL